MSLLDVPTTANPHDMVLMAVALAAAAALLCASAVLWLRGRRMVPTHVIPPRRRKPLAELAVIAAIVCGFVQHGATKGNGELRMENVELRHECEVSALRSQEGATDLCFAAIEPCTTVLSPRTLALAEERPSRSGRRPAIRPKWRNEV